MQVQRFLVQIVILMLGCSSFSVLMAAPKSKVLTLSIGIDNFNDKLWHPLQYASKDARDILESLKENFFTSDSKSKAVHYKLITTKTQKYAISAKKVFEAFDRLEKQNRRDEDVVFVYFSTHGSVAYKPDGSLGRYIITETTNSRDLDKTAIDYDQLLHRFHALKARKKVLILAFCHSGSGKSVLTPDMKRALSRLKTSYFAEPIHVRSENAVVLAASGWREPALEDEAAKYDVYTHFLIEGFKYDLNGDRATSITEAHSYAATATYEFTKGRQRPSATIQLLGQDPILVRGALPSTAPATLFNLEKHLKRFLVSIDGKDATTLTKGTAISPGRRRVTVYSEDQSEVLADRVVQVRAGHEYLLEDIMRPRLPHRLSIGIKRLSYLEDHVRESFAPEPLDLWLLHYNYDNFQHTYDLKWQLAFGTRSGEVLAVPSQQGELVKIEQSRSLFQVTGLVAQHFDQGKIFDSFPLRMTVGLGPQIQMMDRRLNTELEDSGKNQRTTTVALMGQAGFDISFPETLLFAGGDFEIIVGQNFADANNSLISSAAFQVYLGSFW